MASATFASIKSILRPVLKFMRDHELWDQQGLVRAVHVFEAIMYSIQTDLSYIVIDRFIKCITEPLLQIK